MLFQRARMHQSFNVVVLLFHVHGIPRVACCAFPHREGALLGQLDDKRNLNRHTLDLLKQCQVPADPCLISSKLEKASQAKGLLLLKKVSPKSWC